MICKHAVVCAIHLGSFCRAGQKRSAATSVHFNTEGLCLPSVRARLCVTPSLAPLSAAWPALQHRSCQFLSHKAGSLPLVCRAAAASGADLPTQHTALAAAKRWLKRFLILLGFAASCCAVLLLSLPSLISSPSWRPRALGVCNRFLPARVSIDQVQEAILCLSKQ